MAKIAPTLTELQRISLAAFCDVLLPGDEHWPAASVAVGSPDAVLEAVQPADQTWLRDEAEAIAALPPEARSTAMEARELSEPGCFGRVLAVLYAVYYGSTLVHEQVVALAKAGPREPSGTFDTTLLQHVIATQAGRRRV